MYRRGDLGQVARAVRVLDGLRGFKHGRRLGELAAEVGTSERTVRRDVAALSAAGYEIDFVLVEGRAAARLVERSYSSVPITRRERFTLLAVRSVFDVLRGTPLHDDIQSVLAKLEQRMSREEREEHATFGERFLYVPDHGTKSYDGKEDVIDALQTGILSRRVVRYEYADARGRPREGLLAPYAMVLYRHGLYVVGGRLASTNTMRHSATIGIFAMERFTAAEAIRGRAFTVPPDLHLSDVLHGTFGLHVESRSAPEHVVIEFSKEKARLVAARTWHPTQRLDHDEDGRVILRFDCIDLPPVVSWILEWGPHARALAPERLVQMVVSELEAARARYASSR